MVGVTFVLCQLCGGAVAVPMDMLATSKPRSSVYCV